MHTRLVIWYEAGPDLRVSLEVSMDEDHLVPPENSWKTVLVLSEIDEIKDIRQAQLEGREW